MLAISVRIAMKAGRLLIERGKNQKVLFIRQSASGLKSRCLELLSLTYHNVSALSRMHLSHYLQKDRKTFKFSGPVQRFKYGGLCILASYGRYRLWEQREIN
jgi:hypothetical protein